MQQNNRDVSDRLDVIFEKVQKAAEFSGRKVEDIRIMAVTKTVSPERINVSYEKGIRLFGENRVQEYLGKCDEYVFPSSMVHFIGHLQTNKVKYIINKVCCIESVSSLLLAQEIEKRAAAAKITMPVFLEVNIAAEESKSGFSPRELEEAIPQMVSFPHIRLEGMMCIPKEGEGEYWFSKMEELYHNWQAKELAGTDFRFLSMGMSEDYEAAIRHGSNIVRLGRAIFGERSGTYLK